MGMKTAAGSGEKSAIREAVRGALAAGASVAAVLLLAGTPGAAVRAATSVESQLLQFDIPAQSMATALLRFSEQAGIQITMPGADTRSISTAGVQGNYPADEALQILLRGTGLRFRYVDDETVVVTAARAAVSAERQGRFLLAMAQTQEQPAGSQGAQPETAAAATDEATDSTGESSGTELDYVLVQGTRRRDEITLGRTGSTLRETPQSVTIMSQARIEAQNLRSLDEVLIQTPGIILLADSSIENTYTARGHVIESIQYDNLTTGTAAETMASPNMAMFEGVEVLRGSNGILNGVNGFGSINMRRKRPLDNFQISTALTGGTWDRYHGEVDVTGPISDRVRARFVASYDDKGYFYDYASFEETLLYGTVEFDLTDSTTMRFATHWQDTEALPNSPGVPYYTDGGDLGLPRDTMLSPAWSNFKYDTKNYMAEVEHEFGGGWRGRAIASHFDTESSNDYAYHWGGIDRATGETPEDWMGLIGEQLQLGFEQSSADLSFWGPVSFFGRKHEVLAGVVRSQSHYSWYYADTTDQIFEAHSLEDLRNWDPTSVPRPTKVAPQYYGPDDYMSQTGVYARIALNVSDPLTVILGARVNYYKFRGDSIDASVDEVYDSAFQELDGDVSPQVGVTYRLNDTWSLYGSYSDLLIPQNARESIGAEGELGDLLDPIEAANYEAGIKGELFGGRFNTSFALFRVEESNRAMADANVPPGPLQGSVAAGKTVSDGFEIETSGQLMSNWTLDLGYTYNTNEYVKADANDWGEDVVKRPFATFTPKHIYRLWTNYRLPIQEGRWSVSAGISGQSRVATPILGTDWNNFMVKDGYTLLNLRAGYRINENWSASVNLHNVTDETYYAGSVGTNPSGNHFYGDPRNVVFAVRAKF